MDCTVVLPHRPLADAPRSTWPQTATHGLSPGRPRTRPLAVLADRAYSSRAIRSHLRRRGIRAVIPQPSDQIGHRLRRGRLGGRPPGFDSEAHKQRNTVERCINRLRQWRGLATRTDKLAIA